MNDPVRRHDLDPEFAYDETQTRDEIENGDTLIAGDVVGFLCDAWPIAVTDASGQFHRVAAGYDPRCFYETSKMMPGAIEAAVRCAREKGLALAPEFAQLAPG